MLANNLFLTYILAFTLVQFFHATEEKKDNLPQLLLNCAIFSLFLSHYSFYAIFTQVRLIPFQHSLPLLLTTFNKLLHFSLFITWQSFSPRLSPAVPHQVSVLLQPDLVYVKFPSVLLIIVNYKLVVMPEAPQSSEKEANEMCGEEWWLGA